MTPCSTLKGTFPLVSFVITYHNETMALLQACLESIRSLPMAKGEAEVIVVDDGMTLSDSPLAEGERLIQQEQAGLSVARNTGIESCRGRYIQFVDADDCLIPSAYEAVLREVRKEEADVVLFKADPSPSPPRGSVRPPLTLHEGRLTAAKALPLGGDGEGSSSGQFFLLHHNLRAAACCYVFKRELLGDLRFHPGLLHEDELFTPLLFLRAEKLVEVKKKAYFYRQHAGTITHSQSPAMVQKRLDDIHYVIKTLHSLGNPVLERRIRQLTVDYLQKAWLLTRSRQEVRRRIGQLRAERFMPLPVRCYSLRYWLASLVLRVF